MDLKGENFTISVAAAEQSDEWLVDAASEILDEVQERGLEIPGVVVHTAGSVAVEAAQGQEAQVDQTDFKESVIAQLDSAFSAYSTLAERLNAGRERKEQVEVADAETVEAEFAAWFTDEKAEQAAKLMEADPELRLTLVATPNTVATSGEIIDLAKDFGKGQPYETYVWSKIYGKYTSEQLSGTNPDNGNAVSFSLVACRFTPKLETTVANQRQVLATMQTDIPDLKVPSVLDDVAYWQTLRAQGEALSDDGTFNRTYTRHFDLPEVRLGGWDYVPGSYVDDFGEPYLSGSRASDGYYGRVAVG